LSGSGIRSLGRFPGGLLRCKALGHAASFGEEEEALEPGASPL
jgi:hypothetical protein